MQSKLESEKQSYNGTVNTSNVTKTKRPYYCVTRHAGMTPWTKQQKTLATYTNKKVSTTVKSQLLEQTCGQAARTYWSNKSRFRGMDIESIDWTVIQTVATRMMINQCQWATKFITGFCTTRQMMYWWGKRDGDMPLLQP